MGSFLHETALCLMQDKTPLKIERKGFWKFVQRIVGEFVDPDEIYSDKDIEVDENETESNDGEEFCADGEHPKHRLRWERRRFIPDGWAYIDDDEGKAIVVFEVEDSNPIDDKKYFAMEDLSWVLDACHITLWCVCVNRWGKITHSCDPGLEAAFRRRGRGD